MWSGPRPRRSDRIPLIPLLTALLATALSVFGHVYNKTLDPWNVNKNQGKFTKMDAEERALTDALFFNLHRTRLQVLLRSRTILRNVLIKPTHLLHKTGGFVSFPWIIVRSSSRDSHYQHIPSCWTNGSTVNPATTTSLVSDTNSIQKRLSCVLGEMHWDSWTSGDWITFTRWVSGLFILPERTLSTCLGKPMVRWQGFYTIGADKIRLLCHRLYHAGSSLRYNGRMGQSD